MIEISKLTRSVILSESRLSREKSKDLSDNLIYKRFLGKLGMTIIIAVVFFFSTTSGIQGVTLSPSSVPTISTSTNSSEIIDKLKQIEILKEKIATKVAEIRDKEKGGMTGIVKKVDSKTITLEGRRGEQTVYYSDDTGVYSLVAAEKSVTSVSKIKEGDMIAALGFYNDDKSQLNAKYIYIQNKIIHLSGKIADIDREKYTVTVKSKDAHTLVDIETYTRTFDLNLEKKSLIKSGFSKFKIGNIIHIIGSSDPKEENRLKGNKIWMLTPLSESSPSASPAPDKP